MPADAIRPALDFAAVSARVAERYKACGRSAVSYVKAKLRHDPVHRAVLALSEAEPFGDVLDIGCGRGQLGIALLEAGVARSVLGLDLHTRHLAQARAAASGLRYRVETRDLASPQEMPAATTVLLVDVLYQLEDEAQCALLHAAARAAARRLIIRTLDPDRGLRSRVTLGLERSLRRVSPHAGAHVNPWPIPRLLALLRQLGLTASVAPCWQGTPFANVLVRAGREI